MSAFLFRVRFSRSVRVRTMTISMRLRDVLLVVLDPAERQRRLAQVYGLIMELSRQKRVTAQAEPDTTPSAAN